MNCVVGVGGAYSNTNTQVEQLEAPLASPGDSAKQAPQRQSQPGPAAWTNARGPRPPRATPGRCNHKRTGRRVRHRPPHSQRDPPTTRRATPVPSTQLKPSRRHRQSLPTRLGARPHRRTLWRQPNHSPQSTPCPRYPHPRRPPTMASLSSPHGRGRRGDTRSEWRTGR